MGKVPKFKAAAEFACVRVLGQRIPIAVRWQLTNFCEARCLFCALYKEREEPPDTAFVKSVLEQLARMGTLRISFSGGEPLTRADIGHIIGYAKALGISPSMNTNGYLIASRIPDLKQIDLLKITVQGPREVHNQIQGGVDHYDQLMAGIQAAHEAGIPFSFATTVTKFNVDHLEYVVDLAARYDTFVAIQPLKNLYRGIDNIDHIAPDAESYRRALDRLIQRKRKGDRHIRNTLPALMHIRHWPKYPELPCVAGRMFAIIETNGDVKPCDRVTYKVPLPNLHHMTVREAWDALPLEFDCSGCGFCGALELNLAGQFKAAAFLAIHRLLNR